ncbi:MAG: hypothetical protein R3B89_34030 [Polyangiaceae bacterium]
MPSATCAVAALEITGNEDFDGTLVVDGALVVRPGATLNSPSGDLTIIADQIVVENKLSATGQNGSSAGAYDEGGGGGGFCLR